MSVLTAPVLLKVKTEKGLFRWS